MIVHNTVAAASNLLTSKTGKTVPVTEVKATESRYEPTVEELAKKIDPSNMSRNDMRELSEALNREGEFELGRELLLNSMVLVKDGDSFRNAMPSDPIMQQKYNMSDIVESNIDYRASKGQPVDHQLALLTFLEKFQNMRNIPERIDTYT